MSPPPLRAKREMPDLLAAFDLDAPHTTEVRRLLQHLRSDPANEGRKTYLLTSAGRSEGKSTTCALMGIVAARIFRRRTLVVDADMWRPTMHRALGVSLRPGFSDLLTGRSSLEAVTRATPIPSLFVLPAGVPIGPIAQVFEEDRFAEIVAQLRERYDIVFIDSAPMVPVVEPVVMARHVDAIILVSLAGRTPLNLARRLKQILEPFRDRVAGLIVNNAARGLPYYYEHAYYGYHGSTRGKQKPRSESSTSSPSDGPSAGDGD